MSNERLPISISAISTSPLTFFQNIDLLNINAQRYHKDIMDGDFVPRMGVFPEFIAEARSQTHLTIDAHVMTRQPETQVLALAGCGVSRMVFHL